MELLKSAVAELGFFRRVSHTNFSTHVLHVKSCFIVVPELQVETANVSGLWIL